MNYIWDVESDNVLQETDDLGATTATYTNEPGEFGGLVSQSRGGTESYYHFDALGSTRELTDDTETVTNTNMYDAWGVDVASSGTTENPFRWVGRLGYYFDDASGKYYIRARRYEPIVGRWLSVDPIGVTDGATLYRYGQGSPLTRRDPSGLKPDDGIDNMGEIGGVLSLGESILFHMNAAKTDLGCCAFATSCVNAEFTCPLAGKIWITASTHDADTIGPESIPLIGGIFGRSNVADDDYIIFDEKKDCTPKKKYKVEFCGTVQCVPDGQLKGSHGTHGDSAGANELYSLITVREGKLPYSLLVQNDSGDQAVSCSCCKADLKRLFGGSCPK